MVLRLQIKVLRATIYREKLRIIKRIGGIIERERDI